MNGPGRETRDERVAGIRFAGFRLDPERHSLVAPDGTRAEVSGRTLRVLRLLLDRPGEVVTKSALLDGAWPDVVVTEDSLTQCISELRKALGPSGRDTIRTVPRVGYQLIPDLPATDAAPMTTPTGWHSRLRHQAPAAALILAVVVAVVAGFALLRPTATVPLGPPTLAVLPLRNIGDEPGIQYFADGTTETLAMLVSRSPFVRVQAATGTAAGASDPVEAGRILDVDYVIHGSVQKSAGTMRIIAELTDVKSGAQVWADALDRQSADPFVMQDDIARHIVASVVGGRGVLLAAYREVAWTRDPTTFGEYDYYLRGHRLFHEETEMSTRQAIAVWEEGLRRFPESALLKIKTAWGYNQLYYLGVSGDPKGDLGRAFALAESAFNSPRMSPLAVALGHWLLCNLHVDASNDIAAAGPHCEKAIDLQPHDPTVQFGLAWYPIQTGDLAKARRMLADVAPTAPNPVFGFAFKAWLEFAEENYEACLTAADMAPQPTVLFSVPFKAACLQALGRTTEAREVVADLMATYADASLSLFEGYHATRDRRIVEREIALLRAAGLRETPPPTAP